MAWEAILVEASTPRSPYQGETIEREVYLLDPPTMQHGHDTYEWTVVRLNGRPIQGYFCSCEDRTKTLWRLFFSGSEYIKSAADVLKERGYTLLTP